MLNLTPSASLDLELARARQLLAAGRREEALVLALALLQQALGHLHTSLTALKANLARHQEAHGQSSTRPEEGQGGPLPPPQGSPYYH